MCLFESNSKNQCHNIFENDFIDWPNHWEFLQGNWKFKSDSSFESAIHFSITLLQLKFWVFWISKSEVFSTFVILVIVLIFYLLSIQKLQISIVIEWFNHHIIPLNHLINMYSKSNILHHNFIQNILFHFTYFLCLVMITNRSSLSLSISIIHL